MGSERGGFTVALALWGVTGLAALAAAGAVDDYPTGTLARAALAGVVIAAVLWVLWVLWVRGHRWPRWVLGGLLVLGMVSAVSYLDARALLALGDAAGLVALARTPAQA